MLLGLPSNALSSVSPNVSSPMLPYIHKFAHAYAAGGRTEERAELSPLVATTHRVWWVPQVPNPILYLSLACPSTSKGGGSQLPYRTTHTYDGH